MKTRATNTVLSFLLIVASTLIVTAVAPHQVSAATGTVSGTVRAANSPVPAGSVQVAFVSYSNNTCTQPSGAPLVGTATDASGQFSQTLDTGFFYKVLYKPLTTAPNKALFRWYTSGSSGGTSLGATATCLTVTSAGLTGIDVSTDAPSVMFTGTLKTSTGAIVSNANVFLSRTVQNWYQMINGYPSKVSESGTWELTGVDVGESNLYIQVVTPAAFLGSTMFFVKKESSGYSLIPSADLSLCGDACKFSTSSGQNTLNMDLRLPVMGQISGTVSGPNGAVGQNEVCVTAYKDGASVQTMYSNEAGRSCTDSSGNYTIGLTYGTYRVSFVAQRGTPFKNEWHNNVSQELGYFGASTVTLSVGSPTALVNATLDVGKSIAGRVTDSSGNPIADATVSALTKSAEGYDIHANYGRTASDGTYIIYGLNSGTFRLMAQHPDFGMTWMGGSRQQATEFTIGANDEGTTGKNLQYPVGFTMSGTISTELNLDSRVCVTAFKITDSDYGWGEPTNGNCFNAPSAWMLKGIQPGTYRIRFDTQGGDLRPTFLGGTDILDATIVTVTNSSLSNLNVNLAAGKSIAGKLVNTDPSAVANACVTAFKVDENSWGPGMYAASTCSGTTGEFVLRGLTNGTYNIQINAPQNSDYVPGFYNEAGKLERKHGDASQVTISDSSQRITTLSTVTIQKGPKFTATTKSGGTGVSPVCVTAFKVGSEFGWGEWAGQSCSSSGGTLNLRGLESGGKYRFQVNAYESNYITGWYRANTTTTTDMTLASEVTLGTTDTSLGDINLVAGTSVTGRITYGGNGVTGACVQSLEDDGSTWGRWTSNTCTNSLGNFTLRGLDSSKTYRFRVDVWNGDYKGGFITSSGGLQNGPEGISSISVPNDLGDVVLISAPSIQGVISSTGSPKESNVCVNAIDYDTRQWTTSSCSNPSGAFSLRGLEAGSRYLLQIWTQKTNLLGGWYISANQNDPTVTDNQNSAETILVPVSGIRNLRITLSDGGSISATLSGGLCVAAWTKPDSDSSSRTDAAAVACTSTTGTVVLKGLQPSTPYYLQVFSPTGATVTQTAPGLNQAVYTGGTVTITAS